MREQHVKDAISTEDIEFLMRTGLLRVTPDHLKRSLLLALKRMQISRGQRIVTQGEEGNELYILQEGSCSVNVERHREIHPLGRLKSGDIFGEMALVTGDCRSSHIDAESDVIVWALEKNVFDRLCTDCPDILEFVTELATERLCGRKITAEKSIGRYRITDVVAEGGWSIVYKGFHSLLKLPVAVKMLKHSMALDSDFFDTFQREALTIAGLAHENIVRVHDIEHVHKTLFIIMEYLSGITLRQVIDKGFKLPLSRTLDILMQACRALHYAHERGLVHQDVKPGNIFIQDDNRVKIVDFGLAAPIGCCSDDLPGTPYYMAPEQIEGEPVDARTDIYSLGMTAYEMATGVRPYPDDICQVLEYHMTRDTPDPRELNPDLPEAFALLVKKTTEKKPDSRFQKMSHVLQELGIMAGNTSEEDSLHPRETRQVKSLRIYYDKDQVQELDRALKEFSTKLRALGAELGPVSLQGNSVHGRSCCL